MTDAGERCGPGLRFQSRWLALREDLDRAARDRSLPRMLANRLPEAPRLLDLGAGTGSLFRFMAPIIAGPQSWILADADESLLNEGLKRIAEWATRRGYTATLAGGSGHPVMTLRTFHGQWRVEPLAAELAQAPHGLPLDAHDAVVCSALLDLVSHDWMERLFAALSVPFYASMTVDGRDAWLPRHVADRAVHTAFQRDQRRDKGLGPALGSGAAGIAERLLAARGFETWSATSDWHVPRSSVDMAGMLARLTADPARRAMPAQARKIDSWERSRQQQAMHASLAIRIGHRDILAFPPER